MSAAIPYREPQLSDRADVIIRRREKEQRTCTLEPTSGWRKRWLSLSKSENLSFFHKSYNLFENCGSNYICD